MRRYRLLCVALLIVGLSVWRSRESGPETLEPRRAGEELRAPDRRTESPMTEAPQAAASEDLSFSPAASSAGSPSARQRTVVLFGEEAAPEGTEALPTASRLNRPAPGTESPRPLRIAELETHRGRRAQAEPPRLPPGQSLSERDAPPPAARNSSAEIPAPAPSVELAQITRAHGSDVIEVGFLLEPEAGRSPTALILCQEIPEGWEMRQAEPAADAWDPDTRVVKWLRMADGAEPAAVTATLVRQVDAPERDWDTTRAWILYRLPDGRFEEKAPARHFLEVLP